MNQNEKKEKLSKKRDSTMHPVIFFVTKQNKTKKTSHIILIFLFFFLTISFFFSYTSYFYLTFYIHIHYKFNVCRFIILKDNSLHFDASNLILITKIFLLVVFSVFLCMTTQYELKFELFIYKFVVVKKNMRG